MNDEFNCRPLETSKLPNEIGTKGKELNTYVLEFPSDESDGTKRAASVKKKSSVTKMMLGTIAGTLTLTTAVGASQVKTEEESPTAIEEEAVNSIVLLDNAYLIDEKTVCLGDNEINTVWAVITSEPISFSEGTSIEFDILQSESKDFNGSNGADGLSVFFTNDSIKNNKEIGGSLGYKGEFGVEFDLHYNPAYETPDGEDYYGKHISILSDSVWKSYVHSDPLELCDGEWHHVSIDYKDDVLRLVYGNEITLESVVERSFENLYLAFAGATGEGTCYQLVSNITINGEDISFSNMENR